MRIQSTIAKSATIIGAAAVSLGATAFVGATNFSLGYFLGTVLMLSAVIFCVRTFRGIDEHIEPARAWWRMTSRPLAGYLLGALFLAEVSWIAAGYVEPQGGVALVTGLVVNSVLSVAYLHSSLRLSRNARKAAA
ncbi:hypothetical protein FHX49_000722 [Microbacterium endophyticum]|uniref:Uncharacterized protein n=1 Tax=Microbacterium endophyticum TaxID=1526412 RepID=A0A7W4V1K7_9MICO|nr:hypothetical protein [Microbacterium endophyticum]MBB2975181.1 hypothetical protein [Microbacterium endophyticum]NIK37607.1 hypothetical protein [Microbacterium endophyticum]